MRNETMLKGSTMYSRDSATVRKVRVRHFVLYPDTNFWAVEVPGERGMKTFCNRSEAAAYARKMRERGKRRSANA